MLASLVTVSTTTTGQDELSSTSTLLPTMVPQTRVKPSMSPREIVAQAERDQRKKTHGGDLKVKLDEFKNDLGKRFLALLSQYTLGYYPMSDCPDGLELCVDKCMLGTC